MVRRSPLGPWLKLYVSVIDTKAHYSDAAFRALIETWAFAVRQPTRGQFVNRSALDRRVGRENVDYLIDQGDLEVADDGSVSLHRWDEYQSGVLSTGRGAQRVDSSGTVPEQFESSSPLLSKESSSTKKRTTSSSHARAREEATPEEVEAGRKAHAELRARWGGNGHSALLGSEMDGLTRQSSPSLTVADGPGREAAEVGPDEGSGDVGVVLPPLKGSSPSETEPGEAGPSRPTSSRRTGAQEGGHRGVVRA